MLGLGVSPWRADFASGCRLGFWMGGGGFLFVEMVGVGKSGGRGKRERFEKGGFSIVWRLGLLVLLVKKMGVL